MVDLPFFGEAIADRINEAARRGEATARLVSPVVDLVLYRDSDVPLSPKEVRVEYNQAQAATSQGNAATATEIPGTFVAFEPWDVRAGDVGRLPGGAAVRITFVEEPFNGVVRARFAQRGSG